MLYFTAPGCGVCHALKPKVQDMVLRDFPKIHFREVKIQEEPQTSGQHLIFTVPAQIPYSVYYDYTIIHETTYKRYLKRKFYPYSSNSVM